MLIDGIVSELVDLGGLILKQSPFMKRLSPRGCLAYAQRDKRDIIASNNLGVIHGVVLRHTQPLVSRIEVQQPDVAGSPQPGMYDSSVHVYQKNWSKKVALRSHSDWGMRPPALVTLIPNSTDPVAQRGDFHVRQLGQLDRLGSGANAHIRLLSELGSLFGSQGSHIQTHNIEFAYLVSCVWCFLLV
jgi:hypothetical protein